MQDVPYDYELYAFNRASSFLNGVQIEQRLAGVRVPAVAGVDDGRLQPRRGQVRRAGFPVAHHDHVGA